MSADAKWRDAIAQEGEVQTDRRNFMKSAAAAGLLGAAGAVSTLGQSAQEARQAVTAEPNLKPPPGMSPRGIPDLRLPMCYKESVAGAVGVMTQ